MHSTRWLMILGATGLLLGACSSNPGKEGELSHGAFSTSCEWATCDPNVQKIDFPPALALKSSVRVIYLGSLDDKARVIPISSRASLEGDHIRFLSKGFTALAARSDDGVVADFLHARVVAAKSIDVRGPSSLAVGASEHFRGVLRGDDADLGGLAPFEWTLDPPGLLSIVTGGDQHTIELKGLSSGKVRVRASALDVFGDLQVEVTP
jgi:hypothetical protein